jgi:hypothetical protein
MSREDIEAARDAEFSDADVFELIRWDLSQTAMVEARSECMAAVIDMQKSTGPMWRMIARECNTIHAMRSTSRRVLFAAYAADELAEGQVYSALDYLAESCGLTRNAWLVTTEQRRRTQ